MNALKFREQCGDCEKWGVLSDRGLCVDCEGKEIEAAKADNDDMPGPEPLCTSHILEEDMREDPPDCPICGRGFYFGKCNGCGYEGPELR